MSLTMCRYFYLSYRWMLELLTIPDYPNACTLKNFREKTQHKGLLSWTFQFQQKGTQEKRGGEG